MTSGAGRSRKRVLNAGSGPPTSRSLFPIFKGSEWREVRMDLDPGTLPDFVGSVVDMQDLVEDGTFDAIWASHVVEHLPRHAVRRALLEFRRILRKSGFLLIASPDLHSVAEALVRNGPDFVAYTSPAGPITPLDMLYGHSTSIESGNTFMEHKTGFTDQTLSRMLVGVGFSKALTLRDGRYNLWAIGLMPESDERELTALFATCGIDLGIWAQYRGH